MSPLTALQLITVTGRYLLLDGSPATGSVTFKPSTVVVDALNNEIVYPVPFVVALDANGAFSVQIPATDDPDLSPTGWTYVVSESINGSASARSFSIEVPYNTPGLTLDMADVAPATTAEPVVTYALATHAHDAVGVGVTPTGGITETNAQAALAGLDTRKAADSAVVKLTGAQTVAGAKTFTDALRTDDRFTAVGGVDTRVVATASLPAAGATMDGHILIEDAAVGDRNLIIYAGGQRFRIDGGVAF